MIKITINGFLVEVDSVQDAQALIGAAPTISYTGTIPTRAERSRALKQKGIRTSGYPTPKPWSAADVEYVFRRRNMKAKELGTDPHLRANHTFASICNMFYMVRSGKVVASASDIVRDAIKRLHADLPISTEAKPIAESKWPKLDK